MPRQGLTCPVTRTVVSWREMYCSLQGMWAGSVVSLSTGGRFSQPKKSETTHPKYARTFTCTPRLKWNSSTLHSRPSAISLETAFLDRTTSVFLCKNGAALDRRMSGKLTKVKSAAHIQETKKKKYYRHAFISWRIIVTCDFKHKTAITNFPCKNVWVIPILRTLTFRTFPFKVTTFSLWIQ